VRIDQMIAQDNVLGAEPRAREIISMRLRESRLETLGTAICQPAVAIIQAKLQSHNVRLAF
jgi:hypothetical protein